MSNLVSHLDTSLPDIINNTVTVAASPVTNEHWKLFVSLVAISLLCLFTTIIVHILILNKLKCTGWTQFSYLLALFLFYTVFIVALCPGLTTGKDRNVLCKTLSILNQFFFVCAKTWLIIISIDLYLGITIRKTHIAAGRKDKNLRRFVIYSFIGWTFPLAFVVVGIIFNAQYKSIFPTKNENSDFSDLWTPFPDYGFQHCRIPNWGIWEYFVFGNCIFHFVMFALISITIICQRRRIANLADIHANSRGTGKESRSPCAMLLRLFIVVGISWSYIALQDLLKAGNINTKQDWGWHVFRCIYFLQGVLISFITLTNGRNMTHLVAKYPKLKSLQRLDADAVSFIRQRLCAKERKESLQSCVSQRTVDSILP